MDYQTYVSDPSRRRALASEIGTDPNYLWQIATRWRGKRASPDLAERIEAATTKIGPFTVPKETVIFGVAAAKPPKRKAGKASLVAKTTLAVVPLPYGEYEHFLAVRYTVATGPLTAGQFSAFLTDQPQFWRAYADAV